MKFKNRNINRLALPITRACNRRCPECPAVERKNIFTDLSIDELKRIGKLLGPIKTIEITGGEPTFHKDFEYIAEHIHEWFQCKDILLLTNGWLFKDKSKLPLLLKFDRIYITHYNETFAKLYEEPINTDLVNTVSDFMKDFPDKQFWKQEMYSHNPKDKIIEGANSCIYDYDIGDMISYYEGKLYGCCTSWQLEDRGKGIPLTENWRTELNIIELPCDKCFLGAKKEMKFSICIIAKNEANTLPKCISSLRDFMDDGGKVIVLDTGSTDGTPELAWSLGCEVTEVGEKFITNINWTLAKDINKKFVVNNEPDIVKEKDRLFDFAAARNYCASLAPTDMVIAVDGDEYFTKLDYRKINELIEQGYEQFITHFIFSRDNFGNPAIQFYQVRFYNKTKIKYEGIVHEIPVGDGKTMQLPENIYMLEHSQELGKQHRKSYIVGLALDCYLHQDKDRQSHYFARELMYTGRLNSAIKEFKRHITMNAWRLEAAQSMIYIGDCYGRLNKPEDQVGWYNKSFYFDSNRREALIKLSEFYRHNKNYKASLAYAVAALQLPYVDFYANDMANYRDYPHSLAYFSAGWIGDIPKAKEHIRKALEYQPSNPIYLRDLRYYFSLPKISVILPTLGREEGLKRCLDSIKKLNYPEELIELIIIEDKPRIGVPKRVAEGYKIATGEYICFAANDIEFTPDSLILAVWDSMENKKRLVAFDTGVRNNEGYICEHFIIHRSLVDELSGEIFDTRFDHSCCDTLLWEKASKLNETMITKGFVKHYHFSRIGSGIKMDEVNIIAGAKVEQDKKLYKELKEA